MTTPAPPTCSGPSHEAGKPCGREVRALALLPGATEPVPLCATHYQQNRRGRALRPIGGDGPRVRLPGVLVSRRCAAELERRGPTVYAAVVAVLEKWADPAG